MSNSFVITVQGKDTELIAGKRYRFDIADQLPPITGEVMDSYFTLDGTVYFYVWGGNDHEDYQMRDADVLRVTPL